MSRLHRTSVRTGVTAALGAWRERVRYRRELARLDDHLLSDIGLLPRARDAEVAKPFWRG